MRQKTNESLALLTNTNRGRATTASSPLNFLALISFSEIPFSFDIVSRLASSHELDLNLSTPRDS